MADNLLVNRDGQTYQVDMENTKSIQDTDLLLVNRNGTTYTVAGSEISRGNFSEVVITPTSIVPEVSEQILTAVSDIPKVGSDVPADVVWKWYQYDEATGTAGQKELQSKTNREALDTLILPASSAGKFIGCSVTYLAVTIDETERCAVGVPAGPVATMNGLRFDNDRVTGLNGPYSVSSAGSPDSSAWTFSTWAKPTDIGNGFIFSMQTAADSSQEIGLRVYQNEWAWFGPNFSFNFTDAELNKWAHVVVQNKNGLVKFYLNGTQYGGENGIDATEPDGLLKIGFRKDGTGNNNFDGYLSESYFTDGQILPPTTFGAQFPEGWGPLDSTVIKEKIAAEVQQPEEVLSPYEQRANTDQVWSSQVVPTDANTAKVFNGDMTQGTTNSAFVWTTNITDVETLEIYTQANGLNPALYSTLEINGEDKSADLVSGNGWNTISNPPSTLTSIDTNFVSSAEKIEVFGIKVNGRLLVDQGVWNNSQQWSDGEFTSGGVNDLPNVFDGDTTTAAVTADVSTFMFKTPVPFSSSVEFSGSQTTSIITDTGTYNLLSLPGSWNSGIGWTDVTNDITAGSEIRGLVAASANVKWAGIKVDGAILVDEGAQWNTSQVWTDAVSTTQTGNGGIVNKYKGFDGDISQRSYTTGSDKDAKSITYDFTGLGLSGDVRIFTYCGRQTSGPTIQLNDGAPINTSDYYNPSLYDWISLGSASPLNTIKITINLDNDNAYLGAVEVDGKLLVDRTPTWNISQVWSDGMSGAWTSASPLANLYDGDITYGTGAQAETSGLVTALSVNSANKLTGVTKVEIYSQITGSSQFFDVIGYSDDGVTEVFNQKINNTNNGSGEKWYVIDGLASVDVQRIDIQNGDQTTRRFAALKINGELLVDAGSFGPNGFYLPFDPGEVGENYSQYGTGVMDASLEWANTFDGNLSTFSQPTRAAGGVATWTYPGDGIPVNSTLEFVITSSGGASSYDVNGVNYASSKKEFTAAEVGGFLKSFSINNISGSNYCLTNSVYVDGSLLVDDAPPVVNYSSGSQITYSEYGGYPPEMGFNGVLTNINMAKAVGVTSGQESTTTWTPTNPLTGVTKLRYWGVNGNAGLTTYTYSINGGAFISTAVPASGTYMWFDISQSIPGDGTITSIAFKANNTGGGSSGGGGFGGIEVNGELLLDHSSIGIDASGNKNNLFDQNFNLLPYVPGSNVQDWVNPDSQWMWVRNSQVEDPSEIYDKEKLFLDQLTTTGPMAPNGNPGYIRYTPSSPIEGDKIELNGNSFGDSFANRDVRFKGVGQSEYSLKTLFGNTDGSYWRDITQYCPQGLEYVEWGNYGGSDSNRPPSGLYAIRVNDKLLIQTGTETIPAPDTVLDTPMANYAVLRSGSNGNLVNNGNFYSTLDAAGKQIYFESFIAAGSSSGSTHIRVYDGAGNNAYVRGDGSANNISKIDGSTITWNSDDLIGTAYDGNTDQFKFYKNGVYTATYQVNSAALADAKRYPTMDGSGQTCTINFGQTAWTYEAPSGYTALYQSWSQWVVQTLVTKSAEADALKVMLLDHAQTYQAAEDYCEGSVIRAFGELWIAVNEAPATAFADLAAITSHPNWERLNISAN